MKQLLFLLLFPCLCMAQYPANGNQKISLGEQTTADGLVYRGVENDTALITPLSDTSAYIILDTVNNKFYNYNRATNVWNLAGGGVSVSSFSAGTTGLTPSTATTGAVTLGGTLAVANGGTGSATQNFVDLTTTQSSIAGAKTFTSVVTARRFNANTTESGIASQYGSTNATNSYVSYIYNNSDIAYLGNGTSLFSGVNATDFGITTAISSNLIFGTNNLERMRIASGGEIYVAGTTDRGAYNLQVNGTGVWGAGAYVDGSDLNIKDNIQNLDSSLYLINLLAPVMYNYKEEYNKDESKQIGFIAQDVYNVLSNTEFSNAIVKSDGDTLSMAYSSFIPLLTKAIQEQQALIKALEQRIINLENK